MRPREGGLRRGENFWFRHTARAQCLRLSERFFIYKDFGFINNNTEELGVRNCALFFGPPCTIAQNKNLFQKTRLLYFK